MCPWKEVNLGSSYVTSQTFFFFGHIRNEDLEEKCKFHCKSKDLYTLGEISDISRKDTWKLSEWFKQIFANLEYPRLIPHLAKICLTIHFLSNDTQNTEYKKSTYSPELAKWQQSDNQPSDQQLHSLPNFTPTHRCEWSWWVRIWPCPWAEQTPWQVLQHPPPSAL